jgi:hypothetical protein
VVAITGTVKISANVTDFSLPNLISLGGLDVENDADLETVSLPALTQIGDITLDYASALRKVELGALTHMAHFHVWSADKLEQIDLGSLFTCQGFYVGTAPLLTTLSMDALHDAGYFGIEYAPRLEQFALPKLGLVSGWLGVSEVKVADLVLPELVFVSGELSAGLAFTDFPRLESVGTLNVRGDVKLPALKAVAGELQVNSDSKVSTLELPVLESVGNGVVITDSKTLRSFSAPKLLRTPLLKLSGNALLDTLSLPALEVLSDGLTVSYNAELTSLAGLSKLEAVRWYANIFGNAKLERLGMSSLRSARFLLLGRTFGSEDHKDKANLKLETLDLPLLTDLEALEVHKSPELTRFDLPALRTVTDSLLVDTAAKLPACRFTALIAQLTTAPPADHITSSGLADDGVCESSH